MPIASFCLRFSRIADWFRSNGSPTRIDHRIGLTRYRWQEVSWVIPPAVNNDFEVHMTPCGVPGGSTQRDQLTLFDRFTDLGNEL